MRQLKILAAYIEISIKSTISLRESFLLQSFFMFISNIVYFSFWLIYFNNFHSIKGWTIQDISCLNGIIFGAYGLFSIFLGGNRYIARMIFEGDLDSLIVKPKNLLIQIMGSRSVPSGWGDLVSSLAFLVYSGYLTFWNFPLVLLFIFTSCLIIASFSIMMGSLAFWIGDSHHISKQLFEFLLTFSNYPKSIYQGAIKLFLLTIIPSGFIGFIPVENIKNFSISGIIGIVFFTIAYLYASSQFFYRGLRHYTSGCKPGFKV